DTVHEEPVGTIGRNLHSVADLAAFDILREDDRGVLRLLVILSTDAERERLNDGVVMISGVIASHSGPPLLDAHVHHQSTTRPAGVPRLLRGLALVVGRTEPLKGVLVVNVPAERMVGIRPPSLAPVTRRRSVLASTAGPAPNTLADLRPVGRQLLPPVRLPPIRLRRCGPRPV